MTPEEAIFEKIQHEKNSTSGLHDLRLDGPLFNLTHPKVLSAKIQFENDHEQKPVEFTHLEWKAAFYASVTEAKGHHPEINLVFKGFPSAFSRFINGSERSAIIDFLPLGIAVLSRDSLQQKASNGLHRHVLPPWVTYALSPELWGTVGKWTRFHERLHTLFEKYHLLQGEDFPGFYPLKSTAQGLKKYDFLGSVDQDQFILNLNWTFSLSALEKLESAVQKEF